MSSYINDLTNNFSNNFSNYSVGSLHKCGKMSSKDTKAIGDLVCGKHRRKAMVDMGEISHMMAVRNVYRAVRNGDSVCVVTPRELSVEDIFKEYAPVMESRLKSGMVKITTLEKMTVEDLEMECVEDFSGIL